MERQSIQWHIQVAMVGGGHPNDCGVTVHSMTYSSPCSGRWSPWRLWSDSPFNDIFKSLWWAVVTLTTVEWLSIQWHIQVAVVGGGHPDVCGVTVHWMIYSSRCGGRWSPWRLWGDSPFNDIFKSLWWAVRSIVKALPKHDVYKNPRNVKWRHHYVITVPPYCCRYRLLVL